MFLIPEVPFIFFVYSIKLITTLFGTMQVTMYKQQPEGDHTMGSRSGITSSGNSGSPEPEPSSATYA